MTANENRPVALVTGAARRIGAAIVRILHGAGFDVLVHYRGGEAEALALAAELEAPDSDQARPGSIHLVQGDLLDQTLPERLVGEVQAWRGRLDVLVNNASSYYQTPLGTATQAQWDDLFAANLRAPFFLAQAAAPWLKASRGCIVNLVDIHAQRPNAGYPVYCMAKAGNAMMVQSLARELGPEVRVNGVAPGAILWPDEAVAEDYRRLIMERTVLGRPGGESDIARTVLFLVQDAPYITGQIITVDGGRTLQQ